MSEAMKAARRGELAAVGAPGKLLDSLNADYVAHGELPEENWGKTWVLD